MAKPYSLKDLDRISSSFVDTSRNQAADNSSSDASALLSSSPSYQVPQKKPGLLDQGWGFLKDQARFVASNPKQAAKNVGKAVVIDPLLKLAGTQHAYSPESELTDEQKAAAHKEAKNLTKNQALAGFDVASNIIPAGTALKGGKAIIKAAAEGALVGGVSGAGTAALTDGATPGSVIKGAATGAAGGAVLSGAASTVGNVLQKKAANELSHVTSVDHLDGLLRDKKIKATQIPDIPGIDQFEKTKGVSLGRDYVNGLTNENQNFAEQFAKDGKDHVKIVYEDKAVKKAGNLIDNGVEANVQGDIPFTPKNVKRVEVGSPEVAKRLEEAGFTVDINPSLDKRAPQNAELGLRNPGETPHDYLYRTDPAYGENVQTAVDQKAAIERIQQNRTALPVSKEEFTGLKSALKQAQKSGGDTVSAMSNAKPGSSGKRIDEILASFRDTYNDPRFDSGSTIADINAALDEHLGTPGEIKARQQMASAASKEAQRAEKAYRAREKDLNAGSRSTAEGDIPLKPDAETAMAFKRGKATEQMLNKRGKTSALTGDEIPLPKPARDEKIQMRREATAEAMKYASNDLNGFNKALTYAAKIPRNVLKKIGGAAGDFADLLDSQHETKVRYAGRLSAHVEEAARGLTKSERDNFGKYVEGSLSIPNDNVKRAVAAWNDVAGQVKSDAPNFLPDFTPIESGPYFPHMLKESALGTKAKQERAIRHLLESGQAKSYPEAVGLLEDVKKYAKGLQKSGNLEKRRLAELPADMYEQNIDKVVPKYINDSAKRLSEVESFGLKGEKAMAVIEQARREGAPTQYLKDLYDRTTQGSDTSPAVRAILDFRRATSLDFSAITNATQSVNTATKFGVVRTLRGMTKALHDTLKEHMGGINESRINAIRSGALTPESVVGEGTPLTKVGKVVLTPFTKVEEFNRISGNNVAESWTKDLYKKIQAHPDNKALIRNAESIGIDVEKLRRGELSVNDIMKGGRKGTMATQFEVNPIDIPLGWQSDLGKMMSLFGSFSVRQGQFLKNEIVKEAQHGNFMPAVRFLGLMGLVVAPAATKIRSTLQGKPEYTGPEDKVGNTLQKVSSTLGDPFSSRISSAYIAGKTIANPNKTTLDKTGAALGVVTPVAGPIVSGSINNPGILNAFEQSSKIRDRNARIDAGELRGEKKDSPLRPFLLTAARNVPFGDYPANKLFLKDYENKGYMARLTKALEDGDNQKASAVLSEGYAPEEQNAALATAARYAAENNKRNPNEVVDFYKVYDPVNKQRSEVSAKVTALVKEGRRNEAIRVAREFNDSIPSKFDSYVERSGRRDDPATKKKIDSLSIETKKASLDARDR